MALRVTQLRRLEQLEAAVGSEDGAPAVPAVPEAVLQYLQSYEVAPPVPGRWAPWPEENRGPIHAVYALLVRYQAVGQVPSVVVVQREVLCFAVQAVSDQRAREERDQRVAQGSTNQGIVLDHAGTVAAIKELFPLEGSEHLAGALWAAAEAWIAGWRASPRPAPELLAMMQFADAEITVLNTIAD
jgi:hypothetical protein